MIHDFSSDFMNGTQDQAAGSTTLGFWGDTWTIVIRTTLAARFRPFEPVKYTGKVPVIGAINYNIKVGINQVPAAEAELLILVNEPLEHFEYSVRAVTSWFGVRTGPGAATRSILRVIYYIANIDPSLPIDFYLRSSRFSSSNVSRNFRLFESLTMSSSDQWFLASDNRKRASVQHQKENAE